MWLERVGELSDRRVALERSVHGPAGGPASRSLLCLALVTVGQQIVREGRAPMPLWDFSRRLAQRLGMPPVPLEQLSDAVKATLREVDDPRLRVVAPAMAGAGYVYDAGDPDARPVRR